MPRLASVLLMLFVVNGPASGQEETRRRLFIVRSADGGERPVRTAEDWRIQRREILKGMEAAMGRLPARKSLPDLEVKTREEVAGKGYVRKTITFVAEPGDRVPAYLFLPAAEQSVTGTERKPAMLALHPTGPLGKGVVDGQSERPNRAYAKELAQRGYVVLAPDYPSFGDYKDYDFEEDRYESGSMKGVFNHMRCVDLLQSLRDVDPQRIGVIGHSLGGHNALFVAAFDERLKVIVTSCGWTPFHDYYGGKLAGWTSDRYMPLIRSRFGLDPDRMPFDFYGVVASLAPRPFFTNSPLGDGNFDVAGVKKAMSLVQEVYALHGAKAKAVASYPDAGHDFPPEVREAAYEFIDAALK